MEQIWQAVERAKPKPDSPHVQKPPQPAAHHPPLAEVELNSAYLLSKRVVSHNGADQRSRPYDMLRTQVLHSMEQPGWRVLGVTSPTPGCGKTLTAINLAFSIARQENQSVLLVDADLRKPQVANYLGLSPRDRGVLDVLNERILYRDAIIWPRAGNQQIAVLPTASTRESAERMGSRAMRTLLQDLKRDHQIIILDLPPMLSSDDVICVLPYIDCALLVAAVGQSKTSDVEASIRHLETTPLVRMVLNKSTENASNYYYS
jgi:Mrp family chromosome partitioning ATPase